jgi:osmotically-inducible protein OsmY
MDKHYGWQEGRGAQGQGRPQNGQRWSERYRDEDGGTRGARGGEYGGGWEQDERRFTASGADFDREEYRGEDEEYGSQSRGGFSSSGPGRWSQGGYNPRQSSGQFGGNQFRGEGSRGQNYGNEGYGNPGFSGGHYGGFANEGFSGQGNYGGTRGASNQGPTGQRFNQGWSGQSRGFAGQGAWNQGGWGQTGQTFGQGYAGPEYGNRGVSGNQGFSGGQGYTGGPGFGTQSPRALGYGGSYQGRGFAGRGPKGYQRSDERVKEQLSDRLMDDDDIDASDISVEVKNGEVTLTGTVGSREEKRAAEEIAEQSPGVREVQNLLRVGSRQAASSRPQDSTSGQSKSRNTERE